MENTSIGHKEGITLSASVTHKVRKLPYKFVCDGRKGNPCPQMILTKKEGGLGVRNLPMTAHSFNCSHLKGSKLLRQDLIHLLDLDIEKNQRYIKRKTLSDIHVKPTPDSAQWKFLLSAKEDINICLDCGADYKVI